VIFNSCVELYAMVYCIASLKVVSVRRRLVYRWPAEIEKEHLAHRGVMGAGSVVSTAFRTIKSSRILVLIIATGSATKAVLEGGSECIRINGIHMNMRFGIDGISRKYKRDSCDVFKVSNGSRIDSRICGSSVSSTCSWGSRTSQR